MPEISAKDIVLSVNMGTEGSPTWMIVACSTSDGFSASTDDVSVSSKCEAGFTKHLPGDKNWSFSNNSYAQNPPDADQVSIDDLFDMWAADELRFWRLESINPGEYYRYGEGYISALGETAAAGDYLTFDITIQGNGIVTNVPGT